MTATNDYGVTVPAITLPLTKTYHGLTIVNNSGQIVGRIQTYLPKFAQRALAHVYELNAFTWGRPIDIVPGIESGRTLSVSRVEVWTDEIEVELGDPTDVARTGKSEWSDLCEQTVPFLLKESLLRGSSIYRTWEYLGCWFASKTVSQYGVTGSPQIIADAEMWYVMRKQL